MSDKHAPTLLRVTTPRISIARYSESRRFITLRPCCSYTSVLPLPSEVRSCPFTINISLTTFPRMVGHLYHQRARWWIQLWLHILRILRWYVVRLLNFLYLTPTVVVVGVALGRLALLGVTKLVSRLCHVCMIRLLNTLSSEIASLFLSTSSSPSGKFLKLPWLSLL